MTQRCFIAIVIGLALTACADAREQAMDPDESFCTPERDDDDDDYYCSGDEKIASTEALALLRMQLPDCEIYTMLATSGEWLNADGEATSWAFLLKSKRGEWYSTEVEASGEVVSEELGGNCDAMPFEPLDSRRAMHEAIAHFEEQVGTFTHEVASLSLWQTVCGTLELPEAHYIDFTMSERTSDDLSESYYARFRYDGSFIDLIGPCQGTTLAECLAGVIVEPEE